MKKSFGGFYSGGGGGDGGDMIRTLGRVARTKLNNFQESLPSSNNSSPSKKSSSTSKAKAKNNTTTSSSSKHALSLSSPTLSNNSGIPLSASTNNYFLCNSVVSDDHNEENEVDSEWECLENYYDPIFGVVPSTHEVQHALFSLQQALHPQSFQQSTSKEQPCDLDKDVDDQLSANETVQGASSKDSDSDWIEPLMYQHDCKLTSSPGWGRVYDAFHLLETEPSVQKMVVSLSSDKAVWDAVLNNEAVREIRDSYRNAAESLPPSSDEKPDPSKTNSNLLKWIFDNMKAELLEVISNILQFVGDIFKPLDRDKEEKSYAFMENLKSTFLLTVVVLLIVVVARGHKG